MSKREANRMEEDTKPKIKNVETYTDDMLGVLSGNKQGFIKEVIEEQEKRESDLWRYSPEFKKNKLFLKLSVAFFAVSAAVLVYFFMNQDIEVLPVKQRFSPLIFHEQTKSIDISLYNKDKVARAISDEVIDTELKKSNIEGVYLIENGKAVGLRRLLAMIRANINTKQLEAISDNYLIGIVYSDPFSVTKETEQTDTSTEEGGLTDTGNIEVEIKGEPMTLNTSSFFKTATTEFINANAKEIAKKTISDFLDTVDFTTSKIQVVGTYSVERPWDRNEILAEARRVLGVEILMEVLKEKYKEEDVAKIIIESEAKGVSIKDTHSEEEINNMSKSELSKAVDLTQGIQYSAEAKTKSKKIYVPAPITVKPTTESTSTVRGIKSSHPKNKDLFILLKYRSFSDVFAPMRSWENKMFEDLNEFFGYSISTDTSYLLTKNFEDGIVQNKNARILRDDDGNIVIMYVYTDDNSLIITNSQDATKEVIGRLASSKVRK